MIQTHNIPSIITSSSILHVVCVGACSLTALKPITYRFNCKIYFGNEKDRNKNKEWTTGNLEDGKVKEKVDKKKGSVTAHKWVTNY